MKPRRAHSPSSVLRAVCRASGVSVRELTGGVHQRGTVHRTPAVVAARQAVVYLLREHTALSFPQIAVLLGREPTSHSTMHGRYKSAWWRVRWGDVEFINLLDAAREALGVEETA